MFCLLRHKGIIIREKKGQEHPHVKIPENHPLAKKLLSLSDIRAEPNSSLKQGDIVGIRTLENSTIASIQKERNLPYNEQHFNSGSHISTTKFLGIYLGNGVALVTHELRNATEFHKLSEPRIIYRIEKPEEIVEKEEKQNFGGFRRVEFV